MRSQKTEVIQVQCANRGTGTQKKQNITTQGQRAFHNSSSCSSSFSLWPGAAGGVGGARRCCAAPWTWVPGFSAELNKSGMFKGVPERLNSTFPWPATLTPSLGGGYVWRRKTHIPHSEDEPFHGFLLLEADRGGKDLCLFSGIICT